MALETSLRASHRNSVNQVWSPTQRPSSRFYRFHRAGPKKITFGRNDTPPPREVPDTPKFAGDKTTLIKLMATTKRPTSVNAYTAPMFYDGGEAVVSSIIVYGTSTAVASEAYCTCVSTRSFQNRFPALSPSHTRPSYTSSLRPRTRTMV